MCRGSSRASCRTSTAYLATLELGSPAAERTTRVSAAKAFISKALTFVSQTAVQTSGGIGFIEDLALGHDFKRATKIEQAPG